MERMQQLILRDWEGPERDLKASDNERQSSSDLYYLLRSSRREGTEDSELDSVAATSDQQDKDLGVEEYVLQGAVPKHAIERYSAAKENAVDEGEEEEEEGVRDGEDDLPDSASKAADEEADNNSFDNEEISPEQLQDMEYLHQKLSMLQLRLEESQKIVHAERE